MSDLDPLVACLDLLQERLAPPERRRLARRIAEEVRAGQVARIAAQRNPDGTPYTPRKRRVSKVAAPTKGRGKKGAIKRQARGAAMFRKLRKAAYLKLKASASEVSVGFLDADVARIASVHQLGLQDRVVRQPRSPVARYPARVLLGLSGADRTLITDTLLQHLAG